MPTANRTIYAIACAAPPVTEIRSLIAAAQSRHFDVCLICTPTAARWIATEVDAIARMTGHPVRTDFKRPGEPDPLPMADAVLVAPLSFNTLNKWAAGISDTLALGLINEAVGLRLPIVAVPYMKDALWVHPAVATNVATLRAAGASVLDPPAVETSELWEHALSALEERLARR